MLRSNDHRLYDHDTNSKSYGAIFDDKKEEMTTNGIKDVYDPLDRLITLSWKLKKTVSLVMAMAFTKFHDGTTSSVI